jgi:hypothetical protein
MNCDDDGDYDYDDYDDNYDDVHLEVLKKKAFRLSFWCGLLSTGQCASFCPLLFLIRELSSRKYYLWDDILFVNILHEM